MADLPSLSVRRQGGLLIAWLALAVGCSVFADVDEGAPAEGACADDQGCGPGQSCVGGRCEDGQDASADVSADAPEDAPPDAPADAPEDVGDADDTPDAIADADVDVDADAEGDVDSPVPCETDGGCAEGEICLDGACVVGARCVGDVDCGDQDVCRDGICSARVGQSCESDEDCPPAGVCQTDAACAEGVCTWVPRVSGESCDDGSACTGGDRCDDNGRCVGVQKDCGPPTRSCPVGDQEVLITPMVCDRALGECAPGPPERLPCPAGCAGNCLRTCEDLRCEERAALDPCRRSTCQDGAVVSCVMTLEPDGSTCYSGGGVTFTCQSGVCRGCQGRTLSCPADLEYCLDVDCMDDDCVLRWNQRVCNNIDLCVERVECMEGACTHVVPKCSGDNPACDNGRCFRCLTPQDCDDGNPCTQDDCNYIANESNYRCEYTDRGGQACGVGGTCNGDVCVEP